MKKPYETFFDPRSSQLRFCILQTLCVSFLFSRDAINEGYRRNQGLAGCNGDHVGYNRSHSMHDDDDRNRETQISQNLDTSWFEFKTAPASRRLPSRSPLKMRLKLQTL